MSSGAPDLSYLTLLVQRLIDAELLPDAEGARLLEQVQAAGLSLKGDDRKGGLRYITQFAEETEALIRSEMLDLQDGHIVIHAAWHILAQERDRSPDDLL